MIFHNRKFTTAEINYGTPNKKFLVIVNFFKYGKIIRKCPTQNHRHHRLLQFQNFFTKNSLNRRQTHWAEFLSILFRNFISFVNEHNFFTGTTNKFDVILLMAVDGFVFNFNFIEKLIFFVKAIVNKNHQIFAMTKPKKLKLTNLKTRVTTIKEYYNKAFRTRETIRDFYGNSLTV